TRFHPRGRAAFDGYCEAGLHGFVRSRAEGCPIQTARRKAGISRMLNSSRSIWHKLIRSVAGPAAPGPRQLRRGSQRAVAPVAAMVERLEDRTLLSSVTFASGVRVEQSGSAVYVYGTSGDDQITLSLKPGDLTTLQITDGTETTEVTRNSSWSVQVYGSN